MNEVGMKSLLKLLDKIGLPHLGVNTNCSTNSSDLTLILAGVKKYLNLDYLFTISVEPDFGNETINRITLKRPRHTDIFPT